MQKKYGWASLGPRTAGEAGDLRRELARLYKYDAKRRAELTTDRITLARADYEREGPGRTNLRYGFVVNPVG
jgi:hypothetical protein